MKKPLVLILLFAGMTLTSCRKDYICSFEDIGLAGNPEVIEDLSWSDAKDYKKTCENNGGLWVRVD